MVATKIPLTLEERQTLPNTPQRFPASLDEYYTLAEQAEYPLEYYKDHIVAISLATLFHEKMVMLIGLALFKLCEQNEALSLVGSNQLIYSGLPSNFQPDVWMIEGDEIEKEAGKGRVNPVTNPFLVVEILSEGTREYDLLVKLPVYKSITSLQYILYVEQEERLLTLYQRITGTRLWQSREFDATNSRFAIEGVTLDVNNLYPSPTQKTVIQ